MSDNGGGRMANAPWDADYSRLHAYAQDNILRLDGRADRLWETLHEVDGRVSRIEGTLDSLRETAVEMRGTATRLEGLRGGLSATRAIGLVVLSAILSAAAGAVAAVLIPRPEPQGIRELNESMARLAEKIEAQQRQVQPPLAAGDRR